MGRKRFAKKFKSITVDNGSEFLNWPKLEKSCLAQHKKERKFITVTLTVPGNEVATNK